MTTIRIVAEIVLKPGFREGLMPVFQTLVNGSRAESGNAAYDLTVNLDNPDHLFVIETWASEDAIAHHNKSPHFQAFATAVEGKVEKLVITKLKQLL